MPNRSPVVTLLFGWRPPTHSWKVSFPLIPFLAPSQTELEGPLLCHPTDCCLGPGPPEVWLWVIFLSGFTALNVVSGVRWCSEEVELTSLGMRMLLTAAVASLSLRWIVSSRWPECLPFSACSILLRIPLNCMSPSSSPGWCCNSKVWKGPFKSLNLMYELLLGKVVSRLY